MKKLMLLGSLVLVVCSGCQTGKNEGPVVQPPQQPVVVAPQQPVEPPAPKFVEVQVPHPGPVVVTVAPGQGVLTPSLVTSLEAMLAKNGFQVGGSTDPDMRVQVSSTWRVLERLNDWAVWEGEATVRVTNEAAEGALLGTKTFTVKSARGTDEVKTRRDVTEFMTNLIRVWIVGEVSPKATKRKVTERRPVPPAK